LRIIERRRCGGKRLRSGGLCFALRNLVAHGLAGILERIGCGFFGGLGVRGLGRIGECRISLGHGCSCIGEGLRSGKRHGLCRGLNASRGFLVLAFRLRGLCHRVCVGRRAGAGVGGRLVGLGVDRVLLLLRGLDLRLQRLEVRNGILGVGGGLVRVGQVLLQLFLRFFQLRNGRLLGSRCEVKRLDRMELETAHLHRIDRVLHEVGTSRTQGLHVFLDRAGVIDQTALRIGQRGIEAVGGKSRIGLI